jgi:CubicO group peptidase (beta-lactamase class C family)
MYRAFPLVSATVLALALWASSVPRLSAQPVGLAAPLATAVEHDTRFAGVRESVRRLVEDGSLPSLAIAVAHRGEIVWQEGFGWADVERRIPATPRTPYSVASITKPMTATAILRLAERGALDLDRPVNDYLLTRRVTGAAGDAAGATVRRVLSHTAGLPLHYTFFYEGGGYPARSIDEGIRRYGVLVHPAGSTHEYSNLGYGVLERVLEHVTGRGYDEVMRAEVFAPLGMENSSVGTGAGLADGAVRYDARRRPIPPYDFDHRGGSAVFASVLDLVRFGQAHLPQVGAEGPEPRLLSAASLAAMQRIWTPESTSQGYGLGWAIVEDDGGYRRVSHTGGMPGVTTALFLFPDEDLVVAAVTNTRDRGVLEVAEQAAAAVLPGYADALRAQRAQRLADSPPPPPFRPTPELLGEWTGWVHTHEGAVPITLVFRPDGYVLVRLADGLQTLVAQPTFRDGRLIGRFAGRIPTADAGRHPHDLLLNLRLRDGRLDGQASAVATTEEIHFALTSYVELVKRPAEARP